MINRRTVISVFGALSLMMAVPSTASAQDQLIVGALPPMTGGAAIYGPGMRDAINVALKNVNDAGGVLGQPVKVFFEDDQTNPENAVRAARKLVDLDKASVLISLLASSVTAAVAPLCWETKTPCIVIGSADSITELPHQGYIFRTQPSISMQAARFGKVAADNLKSGDSVYMMLPQSPYSETLRQNVGGTLKEKGVEFASEIYDPAKTSLRTEVQKAVQSNPDVIMLGGLVPDNTVILRDLYRSNFKGRLIGLGTGINPAVLESVPPEAIEGALAMTPSPDLDATAYTELSDALGRKALNFEAQVYDQFNLAVLAAAYAKSSDGTAIRDAMKKISQGDGEKVTSVVEGLKLIGEGKEINYQGASGDIEFDDIGNIAAAKFLVERVEAGKFISLGVN